MKKKSSKISYDKYGYLFILPFFVVFLAFQIYPMFYTINLSFTDLSGWKTTYKYVGLDNYVFLLNSKFFFRSIRNTFIIWGVNFFPQIFFAIFFAAIFTATSSKYKGKGAFKVIFYMPNMITAASVALIFNQLFQHPYGPIDQLLTKWGVIEPEYKFLRVAGMARGIISFIQFWMWFGQTMILMIAGMISINPSLYEAAKVDGASPVQMFFKITLPLLMPMTVYILVTSLVGGLQMFDIPFLFNGGGPDFATETLAVFIYKQAFTGEESYNIAAAGSVYLLIIAVVLSSVIFKLLNRDDTKKEGKKI